MSFRCDGCRKAQRAGARPTKVVVAKRPKKYSLGSSGIALGWEVVREDILCTECAEHFEEVPVPPPEKEEPLYSELKAGLTDMAFG